MAAVIAIVSGCSDDAAPAPTPVAGGGGATRGGVSAGGGLVVAGVHRLEEGQAVRELTRERGL